MDYFKAVNDFNSMSAKEKMDYFSVDKSEGEMPDNADDYYSLDGGNKTVETKTAAESGPMSKMSGPDQPVAEPGEAPGAVKDYSDFRDKYGLEYNEKHAKMKAPGSYSRSTGGDGFATDDGAIFTENGVYVGTAKGTEDEDGDITYDNYGSLQSAASSIKKKAEGKGFTDFSSLSDVAGAVHWLTKGDKKEETVEKEPEVYNKSEKLAKAQAGVKAYQELILPNQGSIAFGQMPDFAQQYSDRFKENLRNDKDYAWNFKNDYADDVEENETSATTDLKFDGKFKV